MARRRAKKLKLPFTSMTTARRLSQIIATLEADIETLTAQVARVRSDLQYVNGQIESFTAGTASLIRKQALAQTQHKRTGISGLFYPGLTPEGEASLTNIKRDLEHNRQHVEPLRSRAFALYRTVQRIEEEIDTKKRLLPVCIGAREKRLKLESKEAAKHGRNKALAARADGRTRELASTVRWQLPEQETCPYCDLPLGRDRHADHIYPVSKGGLSVPENMVWCCSECNMKKTDMTLARFTEVYLMDRSAVELRLRRLGKDF